MRFFARVVTTTLIVESVTIISASGYSHICYSNASLSVNAVGFSGITYGPRYGSKGANVFRTSDAVYDGAGLQYELRMR